MNRVCFNTKARVSHRRFEGTVAKLLKWMSRNITIAFSIVTLVWGPQNTLFELVFFLYTIFPIMAFFLIGVITSNNYDNMHLVLVLLFLGLGCVLLSGICARDAARAKRPRLHVGTRLLNTLLFFVHYVCFPAIMFICLAVSPRLTPILSISLIVLTLGFKAARYERWNWRWANDTFRLQQLLGGFIATLIFIIDPYRDNAVLESPRQITEIPVYDAHFDNRTGNLYFSYSTGSEYGTETKSGEGRKYKGSCYGMVNIYDGSALSSKSSFGRAERFCLNTEGNVLIGYDTDRQDEGLVVLDMSTLEVISRHPLINRQVADIVMGTRSDTVYAVSELHNEVYECDLGNGTWKTYRLSAPFGWPVEAKYSKEENALFVSQWGMYGVFLNKVPIGHPSKDIFILIGPWAAGIALDALHEQLFIARPLISRIDVVNAKTLEKKLEIKAPVLTRRIAYDQRRNQLYALQFYPGRLAVIDGSNGKMKTSFKMPRFCRAIVYDETADRMFIGTGDGVFEIPRSWYTL